MIHCYGDGIYFLKNEMECFCFEGMVTKNKNEGSDRTQ